MWTFFCTEAEDHDAECSGSDIEEFSKLPNHQSGSGSECQLTTSSNSSSYLASAGNEIWNENDFQSDKRSSVEADLKEVKDLLVL